MNTQRKNLLVFGYGLAVICVFIFVRMWLKGETGLVAGLWLLLGLVFFFTTIVCVNALSSFYKKWMAVAHFIGGIITALILCILYYVVFSIVGIVLRILRKDLLEQKIDPAASSYWQERENQSFNKESYTKQF